MIRGGSDPVPSSGSDAVSRRAFLHALGLAGVATALPPWLADAAATATPIRPDQGVVVVLTLEGGNDGLNTFVPVTNGLYYDHRRDLAIEPGDTLSLSGDRGLHPAMPFLKSQWSGGRLAIIDGVGQSGPDLSHFVQMDRIMAANRRDLPGSTGWLGRVLDGLDRQPLTGLAVGRRVPLLLQGEVVRGNAVPLDGGPIHAVDYADWAAGPRLDALRQASPTSDLGALGHDANRLMADAVGMALDLRAHLPSSGSDDPDIVRQLRLAALLVNADIGVRVLSVRFGDFDTHGDQLVRHAALLGSLDDALKTFYETLSPRFDDQVILLATSEFGRRVRANVNGTDHGTANSYFAIGSKVNGGFYGQQPSLANLDRWGNVHHTVDYRHVFADVLATWLGADPKGVLGLDAANIGFLSAPGTSTGGPTTPTGRPSGDDRRSQREQVARLYLAYFGRMPDDDGLDYWGRVRASGRSLVDVSDEFASSPEFLARYGALPDRQFVQLAYREVLGREGDAAGVDHWAAALGRGARRGEVFAGFSESAEFIASSRAAIDRLEFVGPLGRLYRAYFLRAPDDEGLSYWINTGMGRAEVSEQFASSSEFKSAYGDLDASGFVRMVYRNVLGRDPDGRGHVYWTSLIVGGTPRGSVMLGFSDSTEFVQKVASLHPL